MMNGPLPGSTHPQLSVPVYLYGEAAREESRKSLPTIRAGEYEALPEKVTALGRAEPHLPSFREGAGAGGVPSHYKQLVQPLGCC